jgi:hypothetical protein
MSNASAFAQVDMTNIDFYNVTLGAYNYSSASNITYNGINYSNVLEVDYTDGISDYAVIFGGYGFQYQASGSFIPAVVGGTVTGLLTLNLTSSGWVPWYYVQNFSAPAATVYQAYSTPSTADDIAVIKNYELPGGDTLTGSPYADTLYGYGPNETFIGGGGNDLIIGTSGINTAVYSGPSTHYAVTFNPGSIIVQDNFGTDGTDTLVGIQRIQFSNQTLIVCFARGTRIATPQGDIAVENLTVGQLVLTESGKPQPVQWIGRRQIDCTRHPQPEKAWPVRIKAGAFGPSMPIRDLWISPAHAVYVGHVFIPAHELVNGKSIVQERVNSVEYFHIELPNHDVLISEGLPTESYLDNGSRNTFYNTCAVLSLHPDLASPWAWESDSYAPMALRGPQIEAVRSRLAARAADAWKPPVTEDIPDNSLDHRDTEQQASSAAGFRP